MADRLGKYELRATLGKGASGTVYEGWDPHIARRVAVKTVQLPENIDPDVQEQIDRFRREAQAAGRLTHPNVVGVFDYGETAEVAYIVMEFVDGESLKAVLDRQERFAIPDVVRLMRDLLEGLGYSHASGVVHRDIKPANLILTREGRVKIADFGIARIENSGLTQVGAIMGTPAYMSPEQISGQPVDQRADIYSAGVVLFQLLTGERPFEGSMSAIMQKALNVAPPRPSDISVTAPVALDAVVLRAMAKRPDDRFPTAAAFRQAMEDALAAPQPHAAAGAAPARAAAVPAEESDDATMVVATPRVAAAPPQLPAPPVSAPPPKRGAGASPALLGGAVLVALLAVGGGVWWFTQRTPDRGAERTAVATQLPPAPTATAQAPVTQAPVTQTPAPAPEPAKAPELAASPKLATAEPAPAPTPTPAPAATPAPAPVPSTSPAPAAETPAPPAQIASAAPPPFPRAALAAALASVPCTLAVAQPADGETAVRIEGVAGGTAAQAALRRAAVDAAPGARADLALRDVPPSPANCRALDLLRPIAATAGDGADTLRLTLADPRGHLVAGEPIRVRARMPDFPAELRIDYLSSDGRTAHVLPNGPGVSYRAAGAEVAPGSADGTIGEVGPPYGTDLIVATASSVPLFAKPRAKDEEPTLTYLKDLQAAIDDARRRGGRVSGAVVVLDTSAK
jgi:serine/threonine-protein kinase